MVGNLRHRKSHGTTVRFAVSLLALVFTTACAERVIENTVTFDPALDPDPDLDPDADDPAPQPPASDDDGDADPAGGSDSWPAPRVIFLNFDGPTLESGPDDARTNTADIVAGQSGQFAPYGEPDRIPEITAFLRDAWSPANIVFTTERPGGGDYTMVVVSPTNPFDPQASGIAVIGCNDSRRNAVVAAFSEGPDGPRTPDVVASAISRELGFSFGLDTVRNPADFMASGAVPGQAFVDSCSPVGDNPICGDTELCPAGSRNSMAQIIQLTYER